MELKRRGRNNNIPGQSLTFSEPFHHCAQHPTCITLFEPHNKLMKQISYYPCFADEETESLRCKLSAQGVTASTHAKLSFRPRLPDSQSPCSQTLWSVPSPPSWLPYGSGQTRSFYVNKQSQCLSGIDDSVQSMRTFQGIRERLPF